MLAATGMYARRGAYSAAVAFVMTILSTLAAFNYYQLPEKLFVMMYKPLWPYADALGLLVSFTFVFLVLQWFAMNWLDEHIDLNPIINVAGGAIFGGLSAVLLGGVLVIAWLMMPGSAFYITPDPETGQAPVILGVDEDVLSTVRFVANERIPGAKSFDPTRSFMETHTYKPARLSADAVKRPVVEQQPEEDPGIGTEGNPTRKEIEGELNSGG